jgi:hypothetical protein
MKIKIIKRAEQTALSDMPPTAPKKRRIAEKVEKWVEDIHTKSEAESRLSFENLFHPSPKSSS